MPTEPLTSLVDKAGSTRVSVWPSGGYRTAEELAGLGTGFLAGSSDAGRRVGTILTNDYMSVALVLGCIANRIPLVSLPTPARGEDVAAYRDAIVSACTSAEVSSIYLSASFAELLELLELDAHGIAVVALEKHQPPVRRPTGDGFELVQFTSGTTGRQKGVVLSDGSLGANVSSILNWLRPAPGDNVCSWLPLSHDMGLVGMLLSSICAGPAVDEEAQVTLMSPETFLRSPSSWLEAMSATLSLIHI